jgi:hypothetical protein
MYIRFLIIVLYRILLGKFNNFLVWLHTYFTPKRSTDSNLRDIILEEIRFFQRKIEQKRWTLWIELEKIADKMGIYNKNTDIKRLWKDNDNGK